MTTSDLITIDPEILGGAPVFKGTRVSVRSLFEYLENNYSLEEFLEVFFLRKPRVGLSGVGAI